MQSRGGGEEGEDGGVSSAGGCFAVNGVNNGEGEMGVAGGVGDEFVANGVLGKGEGDFWNGLDAVKLENCLSDVVTDISSEGIDENKTSLINIHNNHIPKS